MYQCPNCSAGLRFDIVSQNLACDHCGSNFDPYSIDKERDGYSSEYFDARVFICPQCGAHIISSDETAAAFCNYCGGSTILTENLQNEKKPDRIIPFKINKEKCKKIYKSKIRRTPFTPPEFMKAEHLEKMTGVYMPYWIYDVDMSGKQSISSTNDHRKGDYIIHDHYLLTADSDLQFEGISFDAASDFSDEISESIAPFNTKDALDFTPSFLCGFHADVQDLPNFVYKERAFQFARAETFKRLEDVFDRISDRKHGDVEKSYNRISATDRGQRTGLFPVWFLTWRKDDRVAYSVINGESGKLSVDLPVDIRKYLLLTAILTIPLYFLFDSTIALRSNVGMLAVVVISMISVLIHKGVASEIENKEERVHDMGYQEKLRLQKMGVIKSEISNEPFMDEAVKVPRKKSRRKKAKKKKISASQNAVLKVLNILMIAAGAYFAFSTWAWTNETTNFNALTIPVGFFALIMLFMTVGEEYKNDKGEPDVLYLQKKVFFLPLVGVLASTISFLDLHSDLWYYGASVLMLVLTCLSFITLIRQYNRLATRSMPYFQRTGGDESA